jgi:septal ring factor EnvC (AmiA/AmiB activator)
MIKRIVWLAAVIVLAVSIFINVLAFSGVLNPRTLVREKDKTIAQFTAQVKALEEKNKSLEDAQRYLETKLAQFNSGSANAKAELSRILDDYRKLKAGEK